MHPSYYSRHLANEKSAGIGILFFFIWTQIFYSFHYIFVF